MTSPTGTQKEINRRIMYLLPVAAILFVILIMGTLTFGIYKFREDMIYPGAAVISTHQLTRLPTVLYQQRLALRSEDRRPDIYRWYVVHTGVGLEEVAEGQCSHMSGHQELLVFDLHTALTLCDAAQNRTMYIQRSLHFSLP